MKSSLVAVYDAQMGIWYSMAKGRAAYNVSHFPDRFSYVLSNQSKKGSNPMKQTKQTPKTLTGSKPKSLSVKDIKPVKGSKSRKMREFHFSDFQPESDHRRLDELIEETIYIIGIEPQHSDTYGDGYKLTCKDNPKDKETWTASCFGQYVVPSLDAMYELSHEGSDIDENNYVTTTIKKAGNTYRFV